MFKISSAVIIFAISLAACQGTGGTFDNLVPLPKMLKGKVVGNRYFAPDGAFQIATPYSVDSNEWLYGKVKEGADAQLRFVEFGPFAFDLNTYSIDLFPAQQGHNLEEIAQHWWEQKTQQGGFEQLVKTSEELDGRSAIYIVYRHNNSNSIIVSIFVDFHEKYANVFAVVNPRSGGVPVTAAEIVQHQWKKFNDFAESLRVPSQSN